MKKLINTPETVVSDALLGMAAAHPELAVDHEHKIIYRAEATRPGKVALISGGGSGHEPLHGGFVGLGMLDAACAGEVFTSPVPDQMLEATKRVDAGAGVLHIVKNYTGDVMNFEMAAELAAAESGIEVVAVVTNDDVAVEDSTWTAGRRGVGVTVLLEKIVGAAAEEGKSLAEVADVEFVQVAAGLSADDPIAVSPLFDDVGNEFAWVVLAFQPFAELSAADADTVTAAIDSAARLADADVFVDPRYGTFDAATGQVVALG